MLDSYYYLLSGVNHRLEKEVSNFCQHLGYKENARLRNELFCDDNVRKLLLMLSNQYDVADSESSDRKKTAVELLLKKLNNIIAFEESLSTFVVSASLAWLVLVNKLVTLPEEFGDLFKYDVRIGKKLLLHMPLLSQFIENDKQLAQFAAINPYCFLKVLQLDEKYQTKQLGDLIIDWFAIDNTTYDRLDNDEQENAVKLSRLLSVHQELISSDQDLIRQLAVLSAEKKEKLLKNLPFLQEALKQSQRRDKNNDSNMSQDGEHEITATITTSTKNTHAADYETDIASDTDALSSGQDDASSSDGETAPKKKLNGNMLASQILSGTTLEVSPRLSRLVKVPSKHEKEMSELRDELARKKKDITNAAEIYLILDEAHTALQNQFDQLCDKYNSQLNQTLTLCYFLLNLLQERKTFKTSTTILQLFQQATHTIQLKLGEDDSIEAMEREMEKIVSLLQQSIPEDQTPQTNTESNQIADSTQAAERDSDNNNDSQGSITHFLQGHRTGCNPLPSSSLQASREDRQGAASPNSEDELALTKDDLDVTTTVKTSP